MNLGDADIGKPITFTPKEYYRAWFTHFLTTTPLSELQKMGKVYLAAETFTQNQIIQMWEKKHGEKLQVTYVTEEELNKKESHVKAQRVHNYWTQWPAYVQVSQASSDVEVHIDNDESDSLNVRGAEGSFHMKPRRRRTRARCGPWRRCYDL